MIDAKEKQAAAKQTFVFLASISEQPSDEIGQRARKRGFASFGANAGLRALTQARVASFGTSSGCEFLHKRGFASFGANADSGF